MLTLTRKRTESVIIGDGIIITLVDIGPGGKVRLGITAPKDVTILRSELLERQETRPHPGSARRGVAVKHGQR
jgi:carbon storage regulator